MKIRKHATRQHNLPDIAKTSSWQAISKVEKLSEETTYSEVETSRKFQPDFIASHPGRQ
jgi:hypothetical protein